MDSKAPESASETSLATLITDEQSARRIADIFAESFTADEVAVSLGDIGQGKWYVTIHFRTPPDEAPIRELVVVAAGPDTGKALRFERIAAKDWVRESLAGLKPVTAGRFIVHGAHDRGCVPRNRIGIEIEAALAFGTGHHGTTRGCLFALDHICKLRRQAPRLILDVGTGTGVLAIAAARALRRGVLATDIDVSSVPVARENARLNRAGNFITFMHADGVTAPAIHARAPFDLIFANILLKPLQRLAAPLRQILVPDGRIVLSGLLNSQANAALSAYQPLSLERRIELDGWTTLVLRRSGARSVIARRRRDP
jgi:ribosomal protein L11 methyltransferase